MTHRSFTAALLVIVILLAASCRPDTRNESEKRITGKWSQVYGPSDNADTSFTIEYDFKRNKEFILLTKENGQVIHTVKGSYGILGDSLTLKYRPQTIDVLYKARLSFPADNKLVFQDGFSEKHFGKQ